MLGAQSLTNIWEERRFELNIYNLSALKWVSQAFSCSKKALMIKHSDDYRRLFYSHKPFLYIHSNVCLWGVMRGQSCSSTESSNDAESAVCVNSVSWWDGMMRQGNSKTFRFKNSQQLTQRRRKYLQITVTVNSCYCHISALSRQYR